MSDDPFNDMEQRIMAEQRARQRAEYRAWLKTLTPEQFEAERKRTADLINRSPFRKVTP